MGERETARLAEMFDYLAAAYAHARLALDYPAEANAQLAAVSRTATNAANLAGSLIEAEADAGPQAPPTPDASKRIVTFRGGPLDQWETMVPAERWRLWSATVSGVAMLRETGEAGPPAWPAGAVVDGLYDASAGAKEAVWMPVEPCADAAAPREGDGGAH